MNGYALISLFSLVLATVSTVIAFDFRKRYEELQSVHYGDEFTKGCYREIRFATELAAQWHDKYEALAKEKK